MPRLAASLTLVLFAPALAGCSANTAKKHYILAESLWNKGKYPAAVTEFEKVSAMDPHGRLGLQALVRGATTDSLFLNQYDDAIKKFRAYAAETPGTPASWEVLKQVGDLLFTKTDQYDQAMQHYQTLLKEKPDAPEAAEFRFRIAKSHFFLKQFNEAEDGYHELIKLHPHSVYAEKALFEIGVTEYTRGEQHPEGRGSGMESYKEAMKDFQAFLRQYPRSSLAPDARFGIGNCYEELDQLDQATEAYEDLKMSFPDPRVLDIKLARIRERKSQRSR